MNRPDLHVGCNQGGLFVLERCLVCSAILEVFYSRKHFANFFP